MDMAGTGSGFVEPRNLHRGLSVKLPLRLTEAQRRARQHRHSSALPNPLLCRELCWPSRESCNEEVYPEAHCHLTLRSKHHVGQSTKAAVI